MACRPVREAVGMLQDEPFLGAAVDDRLLSGVDGADTSVVAGRRLSVHTVDRDGEIPACRILKRQAALPTAWASLTARAATASQDVRSFEFGRVAPGVGSGRQPLEIRVSTRWS